MKDLTFIAQQLRKPSGDFAPKIAEKMNEGNSPLYDLTFKEMQIADNDILLEIGFGNGFHFKDLLSHNNGLQIFGIDYSKEMVNLAKKKNKHYIESEKLYLTEGSSNHLPYKDQKFDKVFCNMVIYFWENPEEHLSEIFRVLKPKGKFYTGMRTRKTMLKLPFTKYGFQLYTVEDWRSILKENSFKVVNTAKQKDPAFEEEGEKIYLESVCITAEK